MGGEWDYIVESIGCIVIIRWVEGDTGGWKVGQVGGMWDRWVECGTGGWRVRQVGGG